MVRLAMEAVLVVDVVFWYHMMLVLKLLHVMLHRAFDAAHRVIVRVGRDWARGGRRFSDRHRCLILLHGIRGTGILG